MTKYIDEPFEGVELLVDGNEYLRCAITNCAIVYSGGQIPKFHTCAFDGCSFILDGAAKRTLTYLGMLSRSGAQEVIDHILESAGINVSST